MKQMINHKEELKGKTLEATTQLAMETQYLLSSYASKKKIENSFSSLSSSFLFSLFASLMSNCLVISDAEMNQVFFFFLFSSLSSLFLSPFLKPLFHSHN